MSILINKSRDLLKRSKEYEIVASLGWMMRTLTGTRYLGRYGAVNSHVMTPFQQTFDPSSSHHHLHIFHRSTTLVAAGL